MGDIIGAMDISVLLLLLRGATGILQASRTDGSGDAESASPLPHPPLAAVIHQTPVLALCHPITPANKLADRLAKSDVKIILTSYVPPYIYVLHILALLNIVREWTDKEAE